MKNIKEDIIKLNTSNEIIKVENLTFRYEKEDVLKNVSFVVNKGEYVSLIGKNGSGKSTLAKIIMRILIQNEGEIYFNNVELNDNNIEYLKSNVGIVFQNPDNQFIGGTVEDDIAFGLENRNIPTKEMKKLVKEYSKKVGMEKYLEKTPDELSGGQKQRVALAGVLALSLKVIILDEATSMLDPEGKEEIKQLIFEMKKNDPELTIISITHDIEEAYLSDKVIILSEGKIIKNNIPSEVFKNKEEILNLGLDIPFVLKIKDALKDYKIIDDNINDLEGLAAFLCQN